MTEITSPITLSTPSTNTNTNNDVTTTTITPPIVPNDNISSSEYQRSYSWKLPMVKINRPKERTKSEYQREFTWKNDPPSTPSPAPSPAPIAPSPIPQDSITACNTPEPIKPTTITNNPVDHLGSKLNDLRIMNNSSSSINEIKHNGNFVSEPDEKFSSNNNADKWKDGLRNSEPKQSSLTSNLDPRTKKIVALEANRLSKKSRSYSMYSLHDQLKVNETANDLSNPYNTEYNSEFVNWKEYGTAIREDTMASKKRQTENDHTLKRRGSWSSPAPLPAPLKWLEDLNIDLGPRVSTREKLQPTITDSKSIRGITTTITAKSPSRSTRDYYYDEKRPTTSAEIRDYHYERPTTSADIRDYTRPATSLHDYRYDDYDDDDDFYNSKRNLDHSYSKNNRNTSPLRSSTTMGHYRDTTNVSNQYYDDHERVGNGNYSSSKRNNEYYDDRKYDDRKYDDRKYDDRKYDDKKLDDRKYDDRKYDDRKYDDRKYDDRKYDDRKREISKRDLMYDDRRRDDDRLRDHSSYDYDYRKHSEDDPKFYARASDQEQHYKLGHSRNTSYASSNKGSVHDEPTNLSGAPLSYLDAMRHRSSVSSLSSASTPSSPATPTGYDTNDFRWKRNNGLDPRIYKEQNYSPSVISKSSSSSHKYWQFEDEKDKYYHPSALSPSRNKFYMDEEDDELLDGYSSKRQSHDYKPSGMRYSTQISPTPTRSTSPSRDSYGGGRRHYPRPGTNYTNYSTRPPSRATSVSSHATSIEEESAVLTDILKEAELMTLKNLTDQMSIFKPRDLSGIGVTSGRATPSVTSSKRSSLGGQKKSTTTTTASAAAAKKAGIKSKSVPQTKTPTKTPTRTPTKTPTKTTTRSSLGTTNKGIPPSTKKGHRPSSSLSSTSSYREAYQDYSRPPPTNFSAAREALNRARMKVEEMLEIVSNGGSLD